MNNRWQAKYFEKTSKESHINIFRSLEIENYLKQLLRKKEFDLHLCRLNFTNSVLQILVSTCKKTSTTKKNNNFQSKKTKQLNKIKSKNILKTIKNFTGNKLHLSIKVLNLSSHNRLKTNINLSKFKTLNLEQLYPLIITQQDSAKLLGTFIANYLKITKRHNFFFNSLNKSLQLVLSQQNSKIRGIKILMKGRLNNAARSQSKCIKIGTIPLMTKSRQIDYSESTAFTSNGTIGIKIWINHKKKLKTHKMEQNIKDTAFKKNFKNY